jgi:hypothetical protein
MWNLLFSWLFNRDPSKPGQDLGQPQKPKLSEILKSRLITTSILHTTNSSRGWRMH